MNNEKFNVNINCIVFSTDMANNKQYVLSTSKDEIVLPKLAITQSLLNKNNITYDIIEFIKQYVFTNVLELLPQIITLHNDTLSNKEYNSIESIYAFVISKTDYLNNAYWINFNYNDNNKYSQLFFETVQKLK